MSSKLEAYEAAYERLTLEKTAEAYAEAYGTEDGYLPEAYLGAFIALEKEAHVENMVNTFAPETGYIPAKYVSALEKEASRLQAAREAVQNATKAFGGKMKDTARSMMSKVNPESIKAMPGFGPKIPGTNSHKAFKVLKENAPLKDQARYYGAKALGTMANNPGTTAAVGLGAGTLGTGYVANRMMGGGNE